MLSSNKERRQSIAGKHKHPSNLLDQREKYLNYKSENMSISPLGALPPKRLLFEDVFPLKPAPRLPLKRKLDLINNDEHVDKKPYGNSIGHLITSTEEECKHQSLTQDVSPAQSFPLFRRSNVLGTQLFLDSPDESPVKMQEETKPEQSCRQPKYFTFSEEHINLSFEGQLRFGKS